MSATFNDAALRYLLRHAIDPELAERVGVREDRDALIWPYDGFERRRPLTGDRTLQPKGRPLTLWWPAGRPSAGAEVLLCEGEPDALAALTALRSMNGRAPILAPTVAAVPGTGMHPGRVAEELRAAGAGAVTSAMDGDESGRACQAKLAGALREAGLPTRLVELPDGRDLADVLAPPMTTGRR